MNGWILLHKKILDWEWYDDGATKDLFLHLLLIASHKADKWRGVNIKRGQAIVGRKSLSKILGLSEQSIRTSLIKLKSTNEITIKSTNKFSIVQLLNYEKYQTTNHQINQPTNQQSTNNQPTTNHIGKNIKEYKELKEEDMQEIAGKYRVPISMVKLAKEEMDNWLSAKGKTYKDYKAGLRNWVLRDAKKTIEGRTNARSRVSIDITNL